MVLFISLQTFELLLVLTAPKKVLNAHDNHKSYFTQFTTLQRVKRAFNELVLKILRPPPSCR